MITPRQASQSVQSLFAPQAERNAQNQSRKALGGALADDSLLTGKRSAGALTEKKPARGAEKKNAVGDSDESFGAQLEKAVSRKPRADRDRKSEDRRDQDEVGSSDRSARGDRGNDEKSRRLDSERSKDASDRDDKLRDGETIDEKTVDEHPSAMLLDCAVKPVAVDAEQTRKLTEETADPGESASADDASTKRRGAFVSVLGGTRESVSGAVAEASGQSGAATELSDGGLTLEGTGLKLVKPEIRDPRRGVTRGDEARSGDVNALRAATWGVDASAEDATLKSGATSIAEIKSVGAQAPGDQEGHASPGASAEKLIDQRAEIVSRTSRLAALKTQPLTIDSLNELLVTIDPSLASQILRPTSLSGASREGVVEIVKDAMLQPRPERTETTAVDGEMVDPEADRNGAVRERLGDGSGLASRRETSTPGDHGSFTQRDVTQKLQTEATAKAVVEQRRGDTVRERGPVDAAKLAQQGSLNDGALNSVIFAGAAVGALSESLPRESKTSSTGDGTAKTQSTIAAGPTALGGASGSATNQGTSDEQSSSLLQQGASFGALTDDVEGDRALNAAVASQLTRGVSAALRQRVGSMVMKLQPESLGQIRVNIDFASTTLNVRFDTASAQASQAIQSAMSELKSSLVSRGYSLGEARVTIDPTLSESLRAGGAGASSNQTTEVLTSGSFVQTSQTTQSLNKQGVSRPSKEQAEHDSIEHDGGVTDADEQLTVDARGEVVRTKLSAVG